MESFNRFFSAARATCTPYFSRKGVGVFVVVLLLLGGYYAAFTAPSNFVPGTVVRIAHGTSTPEISKELTEAHVISHPALLRALLRLSGAGSAVQTGVYKFEVPQNIFVVAYRLITGDYGLPSARITFVEGATTREMAAQVASALPGVSAEDFQRAAAGQEGYLFPDTYFFQPGTDAATIIEAMRANFEKKIAPLKSEVLLSGHSLADVVTMASIVEKEARTAAARHIVAGILWNRLARGMPLQVDAVFGYIFNRATYSPSFSDLKVDSPYNTYTHLGLPPTPIDNPGQSALEAAANPTKTNYLYYLTGKDNLMHYATTYAGHQANLRKYLQ